MMSVRAPALNRDPHKGKCVRGSERHATYSPAFPPPSPPNSPLESEHMFAYADAVRREDLDELWKIENVRRSLAMLPPGAPGLSRDDAMLLLELLAELLTDPPT